VIPAPIVQLLKESFLDCKSLTQVSFQDGCQLTSIGERAFYGSGLESIVIPAPVKTLGRESFYECASLKSASTEPNCQADPNDFWVAFQGRRGFILVAKCLATRFQPVITKLAKRWIPGVSSWLESRDKSKAKK
jgi:hypothetical protein